MSTSKSKLVLAAAAIALLVLAGCATEDGTTTPVGSDADRAGSNAVEATGETEAEADADAEIETEPDIQEQLAAELETICQDALGADDRVDGRSVLREAAERLAPETDFSTTEITRAANQVCAQDIFALGPKSEPEVASEVASEPEDDYPTYSQFIATLAPGTSLCDVEAEIEAASDGDGYMITLLSDVLRIEEGELRTFCAGAKYTVVGPLDEVDQHGEPIPNGALLTLDEELNFVQLSSFR